MALDTKNQQDNGKDLDPSQRYYDREFNDITSPENFSKNGEKPKKKSSSDDLASQEKAAEATNDNGTPSGGEGSLYNQASNGIAATGNNRFSKFFKNRGRVAVAAGATGGILGIILMITLLFTSLSSFKLDGLMTNLESKAFIRYQASLDARSSKWIQAYLATRLTEIDGSRLPNGDPDNIIFRSNRVDTNNPFTDWYKTMRTSKFEQELLDKNGIKFVSMASKEGNITKFRPAIIDINGEKQIKLDMSNADIRAIQNGDIDVFNTKVRDFVDVDVFENDRQARLAIKKAVKENTHFWQFINRYHTRKNIQNMTGVRNWRFFEKTRDKVNDTRMSIRNKIIITALPESTKSGKIVQCIFGIIECRGSVDPNSPDNRARTASVVGDKATDGKADSVDRDGNVTNSVDRTDASGSLKGSYDPDAPGSFYKFFASQLLAKFNGVTTLVSILDSLYRLDKVIGTGTLVKIVAAAKAAQVVGLFQTYTTARDQSLTGELTSEEFGSFMGTLNNITYNEGWQTAVTSGGTSVASAASETDSFTEAKNKEEYCGAEHQELLQNAAYREQAEKEYHYLCDAHKVGGDTNAETITTWWNTLKNNLLIGPIIDLYGKTGLATVFDWFDDLLGILLEPLGDILIKTLQAAGLQDDWEQFMAWMATKVMGALGAGPIMSGEEPTGVYVNNLVQGAAVTAESSARFQGGIKSTPATEQYTDGLVASYVQDKYDSQSNYDRYFALRDPDSLVHKVAFSYVQDVDTTSSYNTASGLLTNVAKTPVSFLSGKANAQPFNGDNRSMAKFADYPTFEIPKQCIDLDPILMKPRDVTNADDLGLINAEDLTWDLVWNNTAFMDRIYPEIVEREPDDPDKLGLTVYNCAAIDATTSGGIGRQYGYKNDNGYTNQPEATVDSPVATSCEAGIGSPGIYWPTDPHPHTNTHDITVREGAPVHAVSGGKVIESKDLKGCDGRSCNDGMYSYGRYIKIDHGDIGVIVYAHLSERQVEKGDKVAPGQQIGLSGKSGNTYGNPPDHLHIDVNGQETLIPWLKNKNALDPPNPLCSDASAIFYDPELIDMINTAITRRGTYVS